MPDLLFEIGVEDLPARFVEVGRQFLQQHVPKQLSQLRLQHGSVHVQATPRRLVTVVQNVAATQQDHQETILGPSVSIAWEAAPGNGDSPQLSKAGKGFLRNARMQESDLITQQTPKGPVVAVCKLHKGKATQDVLPQALQELMKHIPFAKTMRWETTGARFARPVRWIVCLLGQNVLPMQFADVQSSDRTWAHRFLSSRWETVNGVQDYLAIMQKGFVMLDAQHRKQAITQQCQQLAQQVGGGLLNNEELLNTVSQLVEWPWVVLGTFDSAFLKIPHDILLCEMNQHQKCFGVVDGQGKLLPHFLVVCGTKPSHVNEAAQGNEKVIAARFADGAFYYKKDCRKNLQQHSQQLKNQVFARNLGTMQEKVQRIAALSHWLCEQLQMTAAQRKHVERTAQLCKADLATGVVGEFPKLQGVMGSIYAQRDGEDPSVGQGIAQHDWPRFAGDALPQNETAAVVGIADRLDTLVGILSKTKTVSGSNDPFALRRCAIAFARVVLAQGYRFDLRAALQQAVQHYGELLQPPSNQLIERVQLFIQDRAAAAWSTDNSYIQAPLLQAVFAARGDDLLDAWARAYVLQRWREQDKTTFDQMTGTLKRVSNLLSQVDTANNETNEKPNPTKTYDGHHEMETILLQQVQQLQQWLSQQSPHALNKKQLLEHYEQLLSKVVDIKPHVDNFFDAVMVLDKNPQVRQARVALLQQLQQPICQLADFRRLASLI